VRFDSSAVDAAYEVFARDGAVVIGSGLTHSDLASMCLSFGATATRPGHRGFSVDSLTTEILVPDGLLGRLASRLMHAPVRPVRVLRFDKNPQANWAVPWHQDRTIAVSERATVPGFDVWSRKGGIDHVEPPEEFLRDMVALRLHLDDCDEDNGPLDVAIGSFRLGRIASDRIAKTVSDHTIVRCLAMTGDIVAMRGLSLHASDRSRRVAHRRVLHVDYAVRSLPSPLKFVM
jgi:hypothetical protein